MSWWHYLLLVNFYLVLFFGFYALLLRNETFFQLNRIYLVGAAILSFFIPLMQVSWVKNLFITQQVQYTIYRTYSAPVVIYGYTFKPVEQLFTLGQAIGYLYVVVASLLIIKLLWQLIVLKNQIKKPDPSIAYSFFKKISVGTNLSNTGIIAEHEQVHARQWHTIDVLIIEIVAIINWFNPVVYLYRFAIKYVHEFIADKEVTETGTNKADYALLLLSQTFDIPNHYLTSNFYNHSLLKQRILMLQKNRSSRVALAKYGLSAPLFVLMLILSSATINNSHVLKSISTKAENIFLTPVSASAGQLTRPEKVAPQVIKPIDIKPIKHSPEFYRDLAEAEAESNAVDEMQMTTDTTKSKIYDVVEVLPSFKGGVNQFLNYLKANIHYPVDDWKNNTQGKVVTQFVVEIDGSLSHINVLRSPSASMANEAIRVLNSSPKWIPGIKSGHPVRAMYTVPISFTLGDAASSPIIPANNSANIAGKGSVYPPLYIIDGVEAPDISKINPTNIENVSILKDAAEIAKYGQKGANGVLLITTKKATVPTKTN